MRRWSQASGGHCTNKSTQSLQTVPSVDGLMSFDVHNRWERIVNASHVSSVDNILVTRLASPPLCSMFSGPLRTLIKAMPFYLVWILCQVKPVQVLRLEMCQWVIPVAQMTGPYLWTCGENLISLWPWLFGSHHSSVEKVHRLKTFLFYL